MTETDVQAMAYRWGMFAHLGSLLGYLIPFGNILVPLLIWMLKRQEYPFVDEQGKESLNFQISLTIYLVVAGILIYALIGLVLVPALLICGLILVIMASLKASKGEHFRYPLTLRFIK